MPAQSGGATAAVVAADIQKRFPVFGWIPGRPRALVPALRGVDLTVETGAIHGVIGPNGSGKSTLLRILATLILPDHGAAQVNGHDIGDDEIHVRRSIGFSTGDERSLYWRLSARQNLEFAAALYHLVDVDEAVATALANVGLDGHADRPVSGFSQGMMRRLGLARSLLHGPVVLLLDEATRSLDPVAKDDFHNVVRALRDSGDVTTLLTTHDLEEAAALCDVVSVLRDGEIVAQLEGATERKLVRVLRTSAR